MPDLITPTLAGDKLSLSRLLSHIENDSEEGIRALDSLFPHTGKAHLIGVTGAPGTGKSSLVNRLALQFRSQGRRVAILAVDPSSPFTGGAVLGDRVRMRDLSGDPGIFIRSMASRGSLGGLAAASAAMTQAFDAAGYEVILIETVGAGQSEVDVARLAHTTLVVEAPGLGDDIQAIKAGILEIADILVINKADRPGADSTERALKTMLELAHPVEKVFQHHGKTFRTPAATANPAPLWVPPIRRSVATTGEGLPELLEAIEQHAAHLRLTGEWQKRDKARLETELELIVREALFAQFFAGLAPGVIEEHLQQIQRRNLSPREAARQLLREA
jgi:LAO/AO transport system kinase